MYLTQAAIHPAIPPAWPPAAEPPRGAAHEKVTGNASGTPEPSRYRDIYEPASVPAENSETRTQRTANAPERGMPAQGKEPQNASESGTTSAARRPGPRGALKDGPGSLELTPEEKKQVEELRARDAAVRAHEMAHIMAGGQYIIRRANFSYVLGPDGRLYAVGGDVLIDTSPVPDDPEATIRKAQAVRRAALAPSDPSPQDLRVAAEATRMEFEARMELARQRAEETLEQAEEYNQNGQMFTPQLEPNLLNLFA